MGSPNQPRDARGRWTKGGGALSAADRREAAADAKRIERAKLEAQRARLRDQLEHENANIARLNKTKPTRRDDPHEVVDWEQERAATRERLRKLKASMKSLGR